MRLGQPGAGLTFSLQLGLKIDFSDIDPATGGGPSGGGAGVKFLVVKRCREGGQSTVFTLEREGQYATGTEPMALSFGDSITVQAERTLANSVEVFEG